MSDQTRKIEINNVDGYRQTQNVLNIYDFINRMQEHVADGDETEVIGIYIEYNNLEQLNKVNEIPGASVAILSGSYAIVFIPINRISDIIPYIKDISELEVPAIYTLAQTSPVEASGATLFHSNPFIQLNGRDVLIGIIDTGIDYLNREFMNEDDTTRIVRIWDQSIEGNQEIYGVKLGVEYKEDEINKAIQESKNGGDPYSIVNSRDTIGHGTSVASIAGARGYNQEVIGVAPNCKFAVVKLKEATNFIQRQAGLDDIKEGRYSSIEIVLAIMYLSKVADELNKSMVICIPLGTNTGAHDGTGTVESSINAISNQVGIVCVTGTGNEGDTDTHTEGRFTRAGEVQSIEIRMGRNQKNLNFQIYVQQPDRASLGVVSPSGEVIERIPARLNKVENVSFVYEGTKMRISYIYPDPVTGAEVISIEARGLREGIWQFRLYGDYIVDGRYWSWIPQRSLLDPDTKFLSPSQYTTLTIPGTAQSAIVAAYYNQNNNAVVGQSGRGFTRDGRIKPDVSAGGINAAVTTPGGATKTISGSSVSTAVTAGCCALLLQWAIVEGNDTRIYPLEIRSFLIRGTTMRVGDRYPNEQWGYGSINMRAVFDSIRENISGGVGSTTRVNEEYSVGNLFIRKPDNM
ncbi:S8 family peptidase [Clostridium sp. AL.422]|uniref:S8 family peptidase n=1 Tax=Clostridium lamae TaxID=3044578 RepID=UPI00293DE3A1|nr:MULTISPECIES: S8 family peptidase [unclassified Clostridium]MDV4150153.1 S8 family peptidase [Clostridium sp. AL.422]